MILQSKKIAPLFTVLLLICHFHSTAQAVFKASISPKSIGKNETATLRLMIDNAHQVEQIVPPGLEDFDIVGGPNQESGMEINNGVTRQYIGITFLLKPKSIGKFTIAGAKAMADGKVLVGNSITLTVTKNGSGNNPNNAANGLGGFSPFFEPVAQSSFNDFILKKGENLSQKINKNIFIKVVTNKNTCFVGEPVLVTYKLYTRLKSESSITKNPSFNGFSVIDLMPPGNTNYSIEQLNGREYNVYILRKSQLYPLQAGLVELETAEVDNTIHFIKEEYLNRQRNDINDFFGDFTQPSIPAEGMVDEKLSLQSKPAKITVKPLPELDRPISFKGAVGKFTIEVTLHKNNFATDDAGKLTITISGAGNMSMIIAPDINWPSGIEGYEPKTKDQLDRLTVPVSGTKTFEYTFTASKRGSYIIPAIDFSFFNVVAEKYITLSSEPLTVSVTQGSDKGSFTKNNSTLQPKPTAFLDGLLNNRWWILGTLPLLSILIIWFRKTKKKTIPTQAPADTAAAELTAISDNSTINPFALSEEKMIGRDSKEFYEALNHELRNFLAATLQIPLATITKKIIETQADEQGIAMYTRLQIQQLLDDIEWQLYTPLASVDSMEDMYQRATAIAATLTAASK
jgi:hypothetical protein